MEVKEMKRVLVGGMVIDLNEEGEAIPNIPAGGDNNLLDAAVLPADVGAGGLAAAGDRRAHRAGPGEFQHGAPERHGPEHSAGGGVRNAPLPGGASHRGDQ